MTHFSRMFCIVALVLGFGLRAWAADPIYVLFIGNSFSDDASVYFPSMAKSAGVPLVLGRASLPGHSLKQHASYIEAFEANAQDPKGSPYTAVVPGMPPTEKMSLRAILESKPWNFVTIQQASIDSFKPETFEPYAKEIIDYIQKYAPKAEILVHETWAYREDNWSLVTEKLTQAEMYMKLVAAYDKLASDYHLRQVPSGDAMQMARALPQWKFVPDAAFDHKTAPGDATPHETGGLNKGWSYKADPTGKSSWVLDAKHCNTDGRYLVAATMFQTITGEIDKVTFVPKEVTPENAAVLRGIAKEAVAKKQGAVPAAVK